ncbi:MAG TPA: glycosyltransferase [Solirubrobacteraceae bacterium]|nr:glycosyltransferase [Solirubrobacteraceae bacterium]
MQPIEHVEVNPLPFERFETVLDDEGRAALQELVEHARRVFANRTVWCINSTAQGGGVAEMLASLLAYTSSVGVDSRWVVLNGNPAFFRLTKRIHNRLHGSAGDGGPLGEQERAIYEETVAAPARDFARLVRPDDVVLVHDPQPAGVTDALKDAGARVIWRLHVGADEPNDLAKEAWDFVTPYVRSADAWVFSREQFFWHGRLPLERSYVIPPSIDIFSPKNQDLDRDTVTAILGAAGIVEHDGGEPCFERENGTVGTVARHARLVEERPLPLHAPLVLQVSRWDRLKDPAGVMQGFAEHVPGAIPEAELILAGPSVEGVADDPEGAEVVEEVTAMWRTLPEDVRRRVHLAMLPMEDRQENAAIVNALQRHATVVVQKSLAEGFGLTVAEGMWKSRPLVASAVGGISDQVLDGETGVLVRDPTDLREYGEALVRVLSDPEEGDRMGAKGRRRVLDHFIGVRHLRQWVELVDHIDAAGR